MSLEAGALKSEEEKKKKILSEKQKVFQEIQKKQLEKKKEAAEKCEHSEKQLNKLRDMLDDGKLDQQTQNLIQKVVESEFISEEDIKEIFDKIDEIESTKDIDNILPHDFRITKDEYKKALSDNITRTQTLTKLNTALTVLAQKVEPNAGLGLNLFSGFLAVLDKNLIKIQENHIDIKNSLEDVEIKSCGIKKLTLWEKIKKFLQELFK